MQHGGIDPVESDSDADEPRGEDTGLAAFDDLDPVSTVSALEPAPQLVRPQAASVVRPSQAPMPRAATPPMAHEPRNTLPRAVPPVRAGSPPVGATAPARGTPPAGGTPRASAIPSLSAPQKRVSSVPPPPRGTPPAGGTPRTSVIPSLGARAASTPGTVPSPSRPSTPPAPLVSTVPPPSRTKGADPHAAAVAPASGEERGPGLRDYDETRVVPSEESGPFDDPSEAATRAYPLEASDTAGTRTVPDPRVRAEGDDDEIVTQEMSPETAQEMFGDPVTQQIDASELEPADYLPHSAAPAGPIQDDGLLELSATTSSGQHEAPAPRPTPTPTPMPMPRSPSRPSWRPSQPPRVGFEDDAVTNVLRSDAPIPLPMPARRAGPPTAEVAWPEQPQRWNAVLWGTALVVVAVVVGLVVRSFLAQPSTGMATVITKPLDAKVSIDGRPLVDQTSPFSMQGLAIDVDHELVVEAEGFETQRTSFRVEAGEVKLLPAVELESTTVETGFALDSSPSGSNVVVDGEKLDSRTPVRLASLAPGRHEIRVEQSGYAPWLTHLFLAEGQVVELPRVTLMKLAAANAPEAPSPSVAKTSAPAPSRESSGSSARRRRARRSAEAAPAPAPAPARATAAPAPAAGGGTGILRVNSRPWSQVFVDGRLIGNTPQLNISLSAGQHRVDLVNPQLSMKKSFSVKVRSGGTTTKIVNLVE